MPSPERDQDPSSTSFADSSTEEGPALRDAAAVAARAGRDELAAAEARERYRTSPLPALDVDGAIVEQLDPGEVVHSVRRSAILTAPGADRALGYGGTLYLTSRRLVHLGQVMMTVRLTDIVETTLAGERLLLALHGGAGLGFDIDDPRLFRAELAAATRACR